MKKLVSVIIPTYGGSDYLHRCIDSVLAQTYCNLEVIVVDDNGIGTEFQLRTADKMEKYASDSRVKYVCHKKNINGAAARNTGVKYSSGDYISLLDDDDVFMPNKVERQAGLLDSLSNDYAFVYCSHEIYKNDLLFRTSHANRSGDLFFEKACGQFEIQTSGVLIRRKIYEEFGGFDESFRRHQDWEFLERIMSKYKIQADDFIGYKRFLYGRTDSTSPQQSKEFRLHYLAKMEPYFCLLSHEKHKQIVYNHRIAIAFEFLKKGMITNFIRELFEIKLNWYGWKLFFKKTCVIIKKII